MAVQEADIYMVQGDLAPPVEATLLDNEGNPMDLTHADSVTFQARLQGSGRLVSGLCEVVTPTVVNAVPVGKVTYQWVTGDTDHIGLYNVTFRIVWAGGAPQTVPNFAPKQLQIRAA